MEIFRAVACAPPSCSCPVLTVENIEGEDRVVITDDYNGMAVMTKREFNLLVGKYLTRFEV